MAEPTLARSVIAMAFQDATVETVALTHKTSARPTGVEQAQARRFLLGSEEQSTLEFWCQQAELSRENVQTVAETLQRDSWRVPQTWIPK